jgi:Leucine-rich repeat (LRR) protein
LTSLPASLIQLRKLSLLDAHRNRLGALPERLGELPALTSLDISTNLLRELPLDCLLIASLIAS